MSPRIRADRCTSASRSSLIPTVRAAALRLPSSSTGPLRRLPGKKRWVHVSTGEQVLRRREKGRVEDGGRGEGRHTNGAVALARQVGQRQVVSDLAGQLVVSVAYGEVEAAGAGGGTGHGSLLRFAGDTHKTNGLVPMRAKVCVVYLCVWYVVKHTTTLREKRPRFWFWCLAWAGLPMSGSLGERGLGREEFQREAELMGKR